MSNYYHLIIIKNIITIITPTTTHTHRHTRTRVGPGLPLPFLGQAWPSPSFWVGAWPTPTRRAIPDPRKEGPTPTPTQKLQRHIKKVTYILFIYDSKPSHPPLWCRVLTSPFLFSWAGPGLLLLPFGSGPALPFLCSWVRPWPSPFLPLFVWAWPTPKGQLPKRRADPRPEGPTSYPRELPTPVQEREGPTPNPKRNCQPPSPRHANS